MERSYRQIIWLFIGIALIIFAGFYKTYFQYFPHWSKVDNFHHFHAIVLCCWLTLLIVQPWLIRRKQFAWHNRLGKLSYFLVPVMIVSMLIAYKTQYLRLEASGTPHKDNLATLFMPFTDVFPFAVYFVMAMLNSNHVQKHMRFIIATGLIVLESGLFRILFFYFRLPFVTSFNLTILTVALLFIALIAYDYRNGKPVRRNSFSTALLIFLVPNMLFFLIPRTAWFQYIAEGFVKQVF
ncbi:hypothetical protein [Flavihumibacter petaseus]|uniref:Uncharacterized protein n=1 Tax=Flavihumibacter petaseus NBRC 106054 TaxID=1220578 RepID=A0A0E9MZM2_9BACT|nr:hypothetical protein [Flavihumibacter petaseus]GAO43202.1 hypothetical protein FPE01S_02_03060 [Flavihumibacter petaseus NBRC 106054]